MSKERPKKFSPVGDYKNQGVKIYTWWKDHTDKMELQLGLQEEAEFDSRPPFPAFVSKSPFIHQCNKQTLSDCIMLGALLGPCLRWKVSILETSHLP